MLEAVVLVGPMDLRILIVGLVVLLGAGGVGWYAWRRRVARRTAAVPPAEDDWDLDAAVYRLVRHSDDLRALYATLGYDLEVEAQVGQILEALKGMIRTEIPDFTALWGVLTEASLPEAPAPLPGLQVPEPHPAERLLREAVAAGPDEQRVRRLLNRAPLEEPVPYAEVLPVTRDGAVTWRPVMEVTLVRKRPSAPDRFVQLLDHLDALVRTSPLERSAQTTGAVLQAVANLRAVLDRPEANLLLALTALEERVLQWLDRAHLRDQHTRKETLDAFLRALVTLRHTAVVPLRAGTPLKAGTLASCNRQAQSLAATYLGTPWMQVPRLTVLLLTAFLELKLSGYSPRAQADPANPAGVLRLIHDEIASGYYASQELIRRLRELEERGVFVHSLVHALLQGEKANGRA